MTTDYHSRRTTVRKDHFDRLFDGLELRISCPYQLIFLLESTADGTKYIELYGDEVKTCQPGDGLCSVIVINRDRLVCSLAVKRTEVDEGYRLVRERAKSSLVNDGLIPTTLMEQLVRYTIVVSLETIARHNRNRSNVSANRENVRTHPQPLLTLVNVILTGFHDLAFLTSFLSSSKIRTDAIVELRCGKIARVREKFVTSRTRSERLTAAETVRSFWLEFREGLNTPEMASMLKNVMVYAYTSKYNDLCEPPDYERIVASAREYVTREMDLVQKSILDVRTEYENFVKNHLNAKPTYFLTTAGGGSGNPVADNCAKYFESYGKYLSGYPDEAMTVPVILNAMVRSICYGPPPAKGYIGELFATWKDESDEGCANYPVCTQYGNEVDLTAKKYDLRFSDYAKSAAYGLRVKWQKRLWGSRPLKTPTAEAEDRKTISIVRRRLDNIYDGGGDDLDWRLCVLALNRLQSNLDVFRGERIEMSTLGATKVTFRPELVEPIGCRTMVQVLDQESENFKRIGHAYFEQEDVVLVGFYDFQGGVAAANVRKTSYEFTVPQWPVYLKDYFDHFYRKKTPECFYAMDNGGEANKSDVRPCMNYTEETEEIRFPDDDCLTVSHRKWRFAPGELCLTYKSKRFEIVRHVVDDGGGVTGDDGRFRIYAGAGCVYSVEKTRRNVVRFTGWTADGGVVSVNGNDGVCLRRPPPRRRPDVVGPRVERCRRYGDDGNVTVEYANGAPVTYQASGRMVKGVRPAPSRSARVIRERRSSNSDGVERTHARKGSGDNGSGGGLQVPPTKATTNSPMRTGRSVRINKSVANAAAIAAAAAAAASRHAIVVPNRLYRTDYTALRHSADGTRRTVEFADGTAVTTCVREEPADERLPGGDWACYSIYRYEYEHPAYRTVVHDTDGVTSVSGFVRRTADGRVRVWLPRNAGRIDVTERAVDVYAGRSLRHRRRSSGGEPDGRKIATFGWNGAETLFERRDGVGDVTRVARRDRRPHRARLGDVVSSVLELNARDVPPSASYFVVKRGMSGFRAVGRHEFDRFAEAATRGRLYAAVHEYHDQIVALFAREYDYEEPVKGAAVAFADDRRGYRWFDVRTGASESEGRGDDVAVPKLLIFRTFDKSLRTDYRPLLDVLRSAETPTPTDSPRSDSPTGSTTRRTPVPRHGLLAVRVNVPDSDRVRAVFKSALAYGTLRYDPARDRRYVETILSRTVRLSVLCACRRKFERDASEARVRLKTGSFLPYQQRDDYGPLKKFCSSGCHRINNG